MRIIRLKLRYGPRDYYVRKASEDGSVMEMQGQWSGLVMQNPVLRMSILKGPHFVCERGYGTHYFDDRASDGFEKNEYTIKHYGRP